MIKTIKTTPNVVKHQTPMSMATYKKWVSITTNNELIREHESAKELQLQTHGDIFFMWLNRSKVCESAMMNRGLTKTN